MKEFILASMFCIIGCNSDGDSDTSSDDSTDGDTTIDLGSGSCPSEAVEYTSSSGKVICCDADEAVFCDENSNGYAGGCWPSEVDCNTITYCHDHWGACRTGEQPSCRDDELICR